MIKYEGRKKKAASKNFGKFTRETVWMKEKGRPEISWMQEATTGIREKGINSMEWIVRDKRRRKIK